MDKEDVVYTHTHTHTHTQRNICQKKDWDLAIWDNMVGCGGYYAKWNKLENDKYCMISLIRGI